VIVSCGIDFGTSNSAVAAGLDGDTAIVDLEHGQPTIPSAILRFLDERTAEDALERAHEAPLGAFHVEPDRIASVADAAFLRVEELNEIPQRVDQECECRRRLLFIGVSLVAPLFKFGTQARFGADR
jgi:molecular chaperone DnaK (HSP70)